MFWKIQNKLKVWFTKYTNEIELRKNNSTKYSKTTLPGSVAFYDLL